MENLITFKTKHVGHITYIASIHKGEVIGVRMKSKRFSTRRPRFVQKYANSYTDKLTTRFQNVAKLFREYL